MPIRTVAPPTRLLDEVDPATLIRGEGHAVRANREPPDEAADRYPPEQREARPIHDEHVPMLCDVEELAVG